MPETENRQPRNRLKELIELGNAILTPRFVKNMKVSETNVLGKLQGHRYNGHSLDLTSIVNLPAGFYTCIINGEQKTLIIPDIDSQKRNPLVSSGKITVIQSRSNQKLFGFLDPE